MEIRQVGWTLIWFCFAHGWAQQTFSPPVLLDFDLGLGPGGPDFMQGDHWEEADHAQIKRQLVEVMSTLVAHQPGLHFWHFVTDGPGDYAFRARFRGAGRLRAEVILEIRKPGYEEGFALLPPDGMPPLVDLSGEYLGTRVDRDILVAHAKTTLKRIFNRSGDIRNHIGAHIPLLAEASWKNIQRNQIKLTSSISLEKLRESDFLIRVKPPHDTGMTAFGTGFQAEPEVYVLEATARWFHRSLTGPPLVKEQIPMGTLRLDEKEQLRFVSVHLLKVHPTGFPVSRK